MPQPQTGHSHVGYDLTEDGWAANASIIRALDPKISVVMVTARADKTSVVDCAKAGAAHYLLKPFDESKVNEVMKIVAPL